MAISRLLVDGRGSNGSGSFLVSYEPNVIRLSDFRPADIILGDVNGDGVANLLDVGPFVEAISTGTFIIQADINQDGVVNLLDVGPFIDILNG